MLDKIAAADWIAIDTEANSLYAYPPQLCLLQISIPSQDIMIDPLAPIRFDGLLSILKDRELILHAADYDLRLLWKHYAFRPKAIFDTMCAARILGFTEFGLTHLVGKLLGVSLEKGPQKMNWGRRPLTERMERYAMNDTHYLRPLAEMLTHDLEKTGRLSWQREICDRLIGDCGQTVEVDEDAVWQIKGSRRLSGPCLGILRELWKWRETEALENNKPPYFILSSEKLIEISVAAASGQPVTPSVPSRISAERLAGLKSALHRGLHLPKSEYPVIPRKVVPRLTVGQKNRYETLKLQRDRIALDLKIDPAIIASRATLISLIKNEETKNSILMRWQRELLFPEKVRSSDKCASVETAHLKP